MTVYQMAYLDQYLIARIFEAVQIAETWSSRDCEIRQPGVAEMFNDAGFDGVSSSKDEREHLSVEYSIPRWIVDLLFEAIRRRRLRNFPSLNIAPHLSARIQIRMSVDECKHF